MVAAQSNLKFQRTGDRTFKEDGDKSWLDRGAAAADHLQRW